MSSMSARSELDRLVSDAQYAAQEAQAAADQAEHCAKVARSGASPELWATLVEAVRDFGRGVLDFPELLEKAERLHIAAQREKAQS